MGVTAPDEISLAETAEIGPVKLENKGCPSRTSLSAVNDIIRGGQPRPPFAVDHRICMPNMGLQPQMRQPKLIPCFKRIMWTPVG